MLIVRLFAPENVITVLFSHPGNVQQHRDLYRGPRRRGRRAQPQRDAHFPVCQRERQGCGGGPQVLQAGEIQVR